LSLVYYSTTRLTARRHRTRQRSTWARHGVRIAAPAEHHVTEAKAERFFYSRRYFPCAGKDNLHMAHSARSGAHMYPLCLNRHPHQLTAAAAAHEVERRKWGEARRSNKSYCQPARLITVVCLLAVPHGVHHGCMINNTPPLSYFFLHTDQVGYNATGLRGRLFFPIRNHSLGSTVIH
jgi:hypothetical protein